MSTAIYGAIIGNNLSELYKYPDPSFCLVDYCAKSMFGISFITERQDLCFFEVKGYQTIRFYLWDSFLNSNCEEFLCPIYYISPEESTESRLIADLEKLVGLLRLIFQNRSVKRIDLYFSDGYSNLSDFKQVDATLETFSAIMLEQYKLEKWIPIVKVSVRKLQ